MYQGTDTIYLIHHSHTDIGYTHDQPIVWDLHRRFIELAIDECERHADRDADDAFRWTVETTLVLLDWLQMASNATVDRFLTMVRAGRIEVTGMPANITPLIDTAELVEALEPIRVLRKEYGIPIRHAMNSDVNGQNWPLVDALLDAGIDGFSMATNIHFGGSALEWPNAFHWEGPSGRRLLAWNGWDYGFAYDAGIDANLARFRDEGWPRIENWLRERDYPLPVLMLQLYDAFGDNGPPSPTISSFVREWNERVGRPRLRIALPAEWWAEVGKHAATLPTYRGDWTDFWNFGCGSSAREVAINRASRSRLRAADAASAVVEVLGGERHPARMSPWQVRKQAGRATFLWDEHTWGADRSVFRPDDEDTAAQWTHKSSYAYTARSLSLMLQRDAVAELTRRVSREPGDAFLIFNPLPTARTVAGPVPDSIVRNMRGRAHDPTAARHSADRVLVPAATDVTSIDPTYVPAFGYTIVPGSSITHVSVEAGDDRIIDTPHHIVEFDMERGGIRRWFSKRLGKDLVDGAATWPLNGWVHEEPVEDKSLENPRRALWSPVERRLGLTRGWRSGWAAERIGPRKLLDHKVYQRADAVEVEQRLELPSGGDLIQRTLLPLDMEWIECVSRWTMGQSAAPEATYIAFPFLLPGAVARIDLGGQAMRVDADQLPRACRDYYTVQGWVDLSNDDLGVTVACPDTPMVQIGDFSFAANRVTVAEQALLLGWVTNNYWETNFRAHQPGLVQARYRLLPHSAPFQEQAAHRFGLDAAQPVVHHPLAEPLYDDGPHLPRSGVLLHLPVDPVLTLRVWAEEGHLLVQLLNASDEEVEADIRSSLLHIDGAGRCDLFGDGARALPIPDGTARIPLQPRQIATLRLTVSAAVSSGAAH